MRRGARKSGGKRFAERQLSLLAARPSAMTIVQAIAEPPPPIDDLRALQAAALALRDDMIMRAELHRLVHGGDLVVEAGAGAWFRFCAALDKLACTHPASGMEALSEAGPTSAKPAPSAEGGRER